KGQATDERPHRWARLVEGEAWEPARAAANWALLGQLRQTWRFAADLARGRPQTSAQTYAAAALRQEARAIAMTAVGERNNQLNRSAFVLGQLVGAGALSRAEVEAALLAAAGAAGLGEAEASATVRSGLESGLLQPRDLSGLGQKPTGGD